jgi:hypothetical protein
MTPYYIENSKEIHSCFGDGTIILPMKFINILLKKNRNKGFSTILIAILYCYTCGRNSDTLIIRDVNSNVEKKIDIWMNPFLRDQPVVIDIKGYLKSPKLIQYVSIVKQPNGYDTIAVNSILQMGEVDAFIYIKGYNGSSIIKYFGETKIDTINVDKSNMGMKEEHLMFKAENNSSAINEQNYVVINRKK